MIEEETNIKIKHVIKEIAQANGQSLHIEVIKNSIFKFSTLRVYIDGAKDYELKIYTAPTVYYKYANLKKLFQQEIKTIINESTDFNISQVNWVIDFNKLDVNHINIILVKTKWEEINELQRKLVDSLKISVDPIDYQNIGNTSRTIMDKLAREVFNSEIHTPKDKTIDVHNGKFKNQLNSYVSYELEGKSNKELRKIAQSCINLVSDSIDVMNKTTHKLDADKRFAELCVVSTINVINVIKSISG